MTASDRIKASPTSTNQCPSSRIYCRATTGIHPMKIIQRCSVCGTECESYNDFDNLEQFFAYTAEEPEFSHDEGSRDCGGTLNYSEMSCFTHD